MDTEKIFTVILVVIFIALVVWHVYTVETIKIDLRAKDDYHYERERNFISVLRSFRKRAQNCTHS